MVGENYCFIYAELFQYTISNGESQTPNFPEGKGGEEGGGGEVCTQASVLTILWTSPSKRNASHLSISIPVVVFLTDVKLLVIFNEGHLAWTSLLHVSSEK